MEINDIVRLQHDLQKIKKAYVTEFLLDTNRTLFGETLASIKTTLSALEALPGEEFRKTVNSNGGTMAIDLTYEITELRKDAFYLENGERSFIREYIALDGHAEEQMLAGKEYLGADGIDFFFTDRDGTINNYCARYSTSTQSIYNAIFTTAFVRRIDTGVILTSGPMKNPGLLDVVICPDGTYVLAASKGREFVDVKGGFHSYPIDSRHSAKLDLLNRELSQLLSTEKYRIFSVIGSGLQFKFGQTTVARQDIAGSIHQNASVALLDTVRDLVTRVDPRQEYFRINDTGLDIEINITLSSESVERRDFDKGDGMAFIVDELSLETENRSILVCGDTMSDLAMLRKAKEFSKSIKTIFVADSEPLKKAVRQIVPSAYFVDNPDILTAIVNAYSSRETW